MVVDTSALIAMLFGEPEAARLEAAVRAAPVREVGAPRDVGAAVVLRAKRGRAGLVARDALLATLGVVVCLTPRIPSAGLERADDGAGEPGLARRVHEPLRHHVPADLVAGAHEVAARRVVRPRVENITAEGRPAARGRGRCAAPVAA